MKTVAYVTMEPELIPRMELQAKTLMENNFKVVHFGWDRRKDYSKEEVVNGVSFIRIGPYSSRVNTSEIQSERTFWGVPGQNGLWNLKKIPLLYFNLYRALSKQQLDILHCTHVALLPVVVLFGKIKRKKIIYEAVEFYISQSLAALPRSLRFLKKIVIYLEGLLVRQVDGVFCIPSTDNKLFKTYSENNSVVREIFNVPVLESAIDKELYDVLKTRYLKKKILVYAGAISIEKGIMNVVKSINYVRNQYPEVKLLLIGSAIGDDTEIINKYITQTKLQDHIDIIGFQPYDKLYTYYCIADIGIGLIQKQLAGKFTKGGSRKLMEYMKASLALLVTNDGDIGIIVKEEECGVLVDMWDVDEIKKKISWLFEHPLEGKKMGERGKAAFQQKYNWNLESKKFLEVYKKL